MRFLRELRTAIHHALTAIDGETYVPARIYWMLAVIVQLFLSVWAVVVLGQDFSVTDFGAGMAAILTAGGVGVWITRKTEPAE